jgi:hypothetical protein
MDPAKLLDILSPNKDDPTVFKIGTIPNTYTTGRPTILFDGESIVSTKTYPYLGGYAPAANDRVLIAMVAHGGVVLGKII